MLWAHLVLLTILYGYLKDIIYGRVFNYYGRVSIIMGVSQLL